MNEKITEATEIIYHDNKKNTISKFFHELVFIINTNYVFK